MSVNQNMAWIPLVLVAGFGLLGIIFTCVGAGIGFHARKLRDRCTQKIVGTIVEKERCSMETFHTIPTESSLDSWFPVYEYTFHNITRRKRSNVGTLEENIKLGQQVLLYINPNHPEEFICPGDGRKTIANIFVGVGIALMLSALVIGVVSRCLPMK